MSRSDMSDLEWECIKCVLPNKSRGVPRVDDRRVINGIFYALRVGCPWRDLPSQYGPYTTVYFNRWSKAVFVKGVIRRFHAASLISGALVSRSGLSQTDPAGCQLRVLPDQRCGFCARASA